MLVNAHPSLLSWGEPWSTSEVSNGRWSTKRRRAEAWFASSEGCCQQCGAEAKTGKKVSRQRSPPCPICPTGELSALAARPVVSLCKLNCVTLEPSRHGADQADSAQVHRW